MGLKIEQFKDIPCWDAHPDPVQLRKGELLELLSMIKMRGYYLQFGVYKGSTLNFMAEFWKDIHFYGFDSFKGLPKDWDLGQKYVHADRFALKDNEIPLTYENVTLIPGWFEDTVPKFAQDMIDAFEIPIAFMDIDSDIYESARTVLDGLNDGIVPGTIIRFDELCDWRTVGYSEEKFNRTHYTTWREHEWKALNEWADKYERAIIPIHRNSYTSGTIRVLK